MAEGAGLDGMTGRLRLHDIDPLWPLRFHLAFGIDDFAKQTCQGITRFTGEAKFARHGGLAPIPVWSGNTAGRVRMTRSGNRQINCAFHRIPHTVLSANQGPSNVTYHGTLTIFAPTTTPTGTYTGTVTFTAS